jgi:hypothetical protein
MVCVAQGRRRQRRTLNEELTLCLFGSLDGFCEGRGQLHCAVAQP